MFRWPCEQPLWRVLCLHLLSSLMGKAQIPSAGANQHCGQAMSDPPGSPARTTGPNKLVPPMAADKPARGGWT